MDRDLRAAQFLSLVSVCSQRQFPVRSWSARRASSLPDLGLLAAPDHRLFVIFLFNTWLHAARGAMAAALPLSRQL